MFISKHCCLVCISHFKITKFIKFHENMSIYFTMIVMMFEIRLGSRIDGFISQFILMHFQKSYYLVCIINFVITNYIIVVLITIKFY